jgi:uncharacterized protein (DUF362 family)
MITRRHFLQLAAGGAACLAAGIKPAFSASYRVGIGNSADPYEATLRALEASGEWPATKIPGKTVAIKPNLVAPVAGNTGATTDPEVVRALVDRSLEAGASRVLIVESGFYHANFVACGYGVFSNYDPRVKLLDLTHERLTLVRVPGGFAYKRLFLPTVLLSEDVVFISAAKLKTHATTLATLTLKNLIGLAPVSKYYHPDNNPLRLGAMHQRGMNQVIVDQNLIRPIDFAVVDGVWAMEGDGPVGGEPVSMDLVFAGRNATAVDRVGLWTMTLPQAGIPYLTYAARKGLGPPGLEGIEVSGDPLSQRPFRPPANLPPVLEYPRVIPPSFTPGAGQEASIAYGVASPCFTRVDIVKTSEISSAVVPVRTAGDWEYKTSGWHFETWEGRDDAGRQVPAGWYNVRAQAVYGEGGQVAYATGWVYVKNG